MKDDAGKLPGQVDAREKAKFEADAALWWNEGEGPFAALHAMNPVRVRFIRDGLVGQYGDCLLYTSDAADEGLGVDLGGRRI